MTSGFDEWVATLGGSSADAVPLLRQFFDEHGPVSPQEAARLGCAHQIVLAREAVEMVGRDIAATSGQERPPFQYREDEGSIRLAYWGREV